MQSRDAIDAAFRHHPPSEAPDPDARIKQHERIREACHGLAVALFYRLPACPERTLALRNVELAMFYANAAVARPRT